MGQLTFFRWAPSEAFCFCVDGGGSPAGRQWPGPGPKLPLKHQWWSAAGCQQERHLCVGMPLEERWGIWWMSLTQNTFIQQQNYSDIAAMQNILILIEFNSIYSCLLSITRGQQICTITPNQKENCLKLTKTHNSHSKHKSSYFLFLKYQQSM